MSNEKISPSELRKDGANYVHIEQTLLKVSDDLTIQVRPHTFMFQIRTGKAIIELTQQEMGSMLQCTYQKDNQFFSGYWMISDDIRMGSSTLDEGYRLHTGGCTLDFTSEQMFKINKWYNEKPES